MAWKSAEKARAVGAPARRSRAAEKVDEEDEVVAPRRRWLRLGAGFVFR